MTLWVILVKEPVCRGGKEHGAWSMEHGARGKGHAGSAAINPAQREGIEQGEGPGA